MGAQIAPCRCVYRHRAPPLSALKLRIPAWSRTATVSVNGEDIPAHPSEYASVRRLWQAGDRAKLHFDMSPRLVAANPRVPEDTGKVAVQRGPLIYCLEHVDQPAAIPDLALAAEAGKFTERERRDLLGGVVVLKHQGLAYQTSLANEPLYIPLDRSRRRAARLVTLTFIPYYAWANREPGPMEVWVPLR